MLRMTLNFVSDGEACELTTIKGETVKDVLENATDYLEENDYILEDIMNEPKWERGDVKGTYWLVVEDEDTGLDLEFELEKAK